jgi:hypothetical protein
MSLSRIRAWPSCTVPTRPACTACVWPSLAWLGLSLRSVRAAQGLAQLSLGLRSVRVTHLLALHAGVSAHRSGHCSLGARHGTAGGDATMADMEQGEALEHPREEATRRASGWRRQLTRASCRQEGWKNWDGGGVLRRGGCSGGQRCPASGWERAGSSGARVPGEKGGKGVLGAPLIVEGFTTAEVAGQRRWCARTEARCSDSDVVSFGHGRLCGQDRHA